MIERRALALCFIALAGLLLPGHSPYAQWYAYRAKHLVVVTDGQRPGAMELATTVASAVTAKWPESKAVAAEARSPAEALHLLATGQLQLALVRSADARDAMEGRGWFTGEEKLPLRAIAVLGTDVLIVLQTYPRDRAQRLARAIADSTALASRVSTGSAGIPFHPGALDVRAR
jgi:TRAP-type uncharacterized transport system substrate-binding protein